jgi:divalent metal cation (Fe/Co/Zn/Cd) transporter
MAMSAIAPSCTCVDGCACAPSEVPRLALEPRQERALRSRAWVLTALTICWNSLEAVVAIVSGLLAGSIALVGFGLDSIVEVSSALIIVWRLARQSGDHDSNERAERWAVRLIALSFFAIAAYVASDAVRKLLGLTAEPQPSTLGLAITALSLLVMPTLAWGKRRVATGLGSVALKADAAETQLCTYLSAVVLLGLASNAAFGWWWMDPVAGIAIAALAIKEGRAAWLSGELCAC